MISTKISFTSRFIFLTVNHILWERIHLRPKIENETINEVDDESDKYATFRKLVLLIKL